MGWILGLSPSFLHEQLGIQISQPIVAGLFAGAVVFTNGLTQILLRRHHDKARMLRVGIALIPAGLAVFALSPHIGGLAAALVGGMIGGVGGGIVQPNTMATIQAIAPDHARGGVTSAYLSVSYLAMSVPVVVAGLAASVLGVDLATVATGYLAATAVIATAAIAASLASARQLGAREGRLRDPRVRARVDRARRLKPKPSRELKEHVQMKTGADSSITTYFRVSDGVRVRFADNKADADVTVLLLSPWPESLWAFRRIWHRVAGLGRVVAIDLPGFGHSDGRPELIAPDRAGAFLAHLIDEWELGAPHVVGPDVGTAAALFLAATAPERVTSLTIGGGAVRFPIEAGGALKDIIEAPSLDVVRGLDARTNIGAAVEAVAASATEPNVHEDYVSAYDLGRFAESAALRASLPRAEPEAARPAAVDRDADPDRRRP